MYKLQSYKKPYARIVDGDTYASDFLADSEAEGEAIAVSMNKPELLIALAAHRFSVETGGLQLKDGLRILTDRESQAQMDSTFSDLKNGFIPDTDWKASNDWKTLDLAAMEPIAKAMAAHRRGCFRGERAVIEAIEAATTLVQQETIDIPADFRQAYQSAFDEVMNAV
ncbi:DUF4376 domain-containing protein [Pseudomonas aeruginosa]|uniref:DUF4376 domain-containing protein n=1 Tax=Pseudomonas aeruginosa TaxID=287 RepID=UPI003981DB06